MISSGEIQHGGSRLRVILGERHRAVAKTLTREWLRLAGLAGEIAPQDHLAAFSPPAQTCAVRHSPSVSPSNLSRIVKHLNSAAWRAGYGESAHQPTCSTEQLRPRRNCSVADGNASGSGRVLGPSASSQRQVLDHVGELRLRAGRQHVVRPAPSPRSGGLDGAAARPANAACRRPARLTSW